MFDYYYHVFLFLYSCVLNLATFENSSSEKRVMDERVKNGRILLHISCCYLAFTVGLSRLFELFSLLHFRYFH